MTSAGESRAGALAALETLERQVNAQRLALSSAGSTHPVPPYVLALLAAPPPSFDIDALPSEAGPRLVAVANTLTDMQLVLGGRQDLIRDRIRAVARRRRPARPAVLVDWRA